MATSSITYNFTITDLTSIQNFINALDETKHDYQPAKNLPMHELTDPSEILAFMKKRELQHDKYVYYHQHSILSR